MKTCFSVKPGTLEWVWVEGQCKTANNDFSKHIICVLSAKKKLYKWLLWYFSHKSVKTLSLKRSVIISVAIMKTVRETSDLRDVTSSNMISERSN